MCLFERVETDVEIRALALKFKEIFHERPHHISDVSTDIIHEVDLHEGKWGKIGSILENNLTIYNLFRLSHYIILNS